MASYAEQQAERQRIKAMQEKQRAKSAAAHQQRVDANAEAKRRQQQQTNQIRAQEAQQAQQQQRLRAQRESERRKNAAARQIEIEQARAKEKSMRIDPALPDPAYDIPSDTSYSARLKAHEKKVERARQEDARRARLGLEPRMYIPEFWTPPPKPGSIEALPIPLVPVVPREGQIRAKTVAPQQSRAAVVADETSASIGQGQQQTPTKPPPTAEDLEIARDKAQIQAREAQQKLDNPNVATPRNREYQDIENIEMQQRGTLGQRVLPALPPPSDEPRRRRRLQGEILEQQQQRTLGRQKWHALPSAEPIRLPLPNPPSRIIEQQQLGTLGQTSRATMQSLQPDPRARYVGDTRAAGSQQRDVRAKAYGVASSGGSGGVVYGPSNWPHEPTEDASGNMIRPGLGKTTFSAFDKIEDIMWRIENGEIDRHMVMMAISSPQYRAQNLGGTLLEGLTDEEFQAIADNMGGIWSQEYGSGTLTDPWYYTRGPGSRGWLGR